MRLIELIEKAREKCLKTDMSKPNFSYGSRWVGDKRKGLPMTRHNPNRTYWTDGNGVRTTAWNKRKNQQREYVRSVGMNFKDQVTATSYLRSSSKVMKTEYEFKEVDEGVVLVKRTNTIWKIQQPITGNRYSRTTETMVKDAMREKASVVEEQVFALAVPKSMIPSYEESVGDGSSNASMPWVGLTPPHTQKSNYQQGAKTTPAVFTVEFYESRKASGDKSKLLGRLIMKELRGQSAALWTKDGVTRQEVLGAINPRQTSSYAIPVIKRKKIKWIKGEETVAMGALIFTKIDAPTSLVAGDNLRETFRNKGANLVCSIPEKCILNYPKNGKSISQEIDKGVYALSVETMHEHSAYAARKLVIDLLEFYKIEYDFNRYDFLTVIDIGSDFDQTEREGSLGRIGSIEEFDESITSEDTSLLDRISD